MAIYRVTALWQGFPGAPGYSTFHFTADPGGATEVEARGRVHAFFSHLSVNLPSSVTIDVQPEVQVIDENSGVIQDFLYDDTELSQLDGGSESDYAGPAGAVINWQTNTVTNGRRLRGRTFLVPLAANRFAADGTLTSIALTQLRQAAEEMVGAGFDSTFSVWSRPTGGGTGAVGPVTGFTVPDMAAVLRSRRD